MTSFGVIGSLVFVVLIRAGARLGNRDGQLGRVAPPSIGATALHAHHVGLARHLQLGHHVGWHEHAGTRRATEI
jgi:hypothetical protein